MIDMKGSENSESGIPGILDEVVLLLNVVYIVVVLILVGVIIRVGSVINYSWSG